MSTPPWIRSCFIIVCVYLLWITILATGCRQDWINHNDICYYISSVQVTWSKARSSCSDFDTDLLVNTDKEEIRFLLNNILFNSTALKNSDVKYWVVEDEREMSYASDSTIAYPINTTRCHLVGYDGLSITACSEMHRFICQDTTFRKQPVVYYSSCSSEMKSYGDSCYWSHPGLLSFRSAEKYCARKGGHLVHVNNLEENEAVSQLATSSGGSYWLGMKHDGTVFVWTNGDRLDIVNPPWGDGYPGDIFGDCTIMVTVSNSSYWAIRPCHYEYKALCERELLREQDRTPSEPGPGCPNTRWKHWIKNNKCYMVSEEDELLSYGKAQQYCRHYKGHLVSLGDLDEQAYVESLINRQFVGSYWIGLKYNYETQTYHWIDGTEISFTNWALGEPNYPEKEWCVTMELVRDPPGWLDSYCRGLRRFICETDISFEEKPPLAVKLTPLYPCPGDDASYLYYNGFCYSVFEKKTTWYDAERLCQKDGGHLVSIHSDDDTEFFIRLFLTISLDAHRVWTGLNRLKSDTFEWSDGTSADFMLWNPGEPNNNFYDEKCGSMYMQTGMWNDENCLNKRPFICKKLNGTRATTTTQEPSSPSPVPSPPPSVSVSVQVPDERVVSSGCPSIRDIQWHDFGAKCFHFAPSEQLSWAEANLQCLQKGGILASIHSPRELKRIQMFLKYETEEDRVWIGLVRNVEGIFIWMDKTIVDYVNWDVNQPTSVPSMNCVDMVISKVTWTNQECSQKKGYVCIADKTSRRRRRQN